MAKTLLELKAEDINRIKKRPAISVFRDSMSLGAILETAYITPTYHLRKQNKNCTGVQQIYKEYKDKNIVFIGEGGAGKTSAFLQLYTRIGNCLEITFDTEFYYCFTPDLLGSSKSLNDYQKALRKIVEAGTGLDGILLLDGIEEAFLANRKEARLLLQKLSKSKIIFWLSCRTNFYQQLDDTIDSLFAEKIEVKNWKDGEYRNFITLCLKNNDNQELIKKRIYEVESQIQTLLCRPLFATMILFVAENDDLNSIYNEYDLIGLFLSKWLERDNKDKKIKTTSKGIDYDDIRDIALSVYLKTNDRPKYNKSISAFRDLLVMSNIRRGTIHGFYHREFLIYFIVNAMIDAAIKHPEKIVRWFSQTFYDDITNMIKPVLSKLTLKESRIFYDNLFSVYKETYENECNITKKFESIGLLPEASFIKLRDEILYFIFKLPNIDHLLFAHYAYEHYLSDNCLHTMLYLGIAYGMAGIDPSNSYTLDFARKLTPGTPEDIRNRGWAMCFFGDVEEDGYTYEDSENKPWPKIRKNRLKRLLSDNRTKYATRVLDIPLLYCFYFSRKFSDCTSPRDYTIIKNTNISLACFGEKQREFMEQQKTKLITKYLKALIINEINNHMTFAYGMRKDRIKMNDETGKIMVEVDEQLANRILKQAEYREDVINNLKSFWDEKGVRIIEQYSPLLSAPRHNNNMTEDDFIKELKKSQVLIISANSVEGSMLSWRLMQSTGTKALDAWPYEGHLFQFAYIDNIPVCHIWPTDTASFTQYGSFSALEAALEKVTPKYVMSVGVAFGINPVKQSLGDVLVSKGLVFYDHFNKVTDGKIKLSPHESYRIDPNLSAQLHQLDQNTPPEEVGSFKWYFGSMLTGGTVLSDAAERGKLVEAAENLGHTVVGGEMEASGIYYACQKRKNRQIPFMIIKGICDWGAVKNGWEEVIGDEYKDYDGETIKNCVQAFACDNAFCTLMFVMKQLNYNPSVNLYQREIVNNKNSESPKFYTLLMELYQTSVAYRDATRRNNIPEINAISSSLNTCMNQVFRFYEFNQFSDKENAAKAKQLVDIYNAFIDSYGQFISYAPGEERSSAIAQQHAKEAEDKFNSMITLIIKYISAF